MNKKYKFLSVVFLLLATALTTAKENSEWFLHSSISPDGKQIAFSYKGDVYVVSSEGGTARPLTIHNAWEGHPVWSNDGKSIAFASDRAGNLDVYLMPSSGGKAKRLSFHSSQDYPQAFMNKDREVVFTSARMDAAQSSIHPTARMTETYAVKVSGGMPKMLSTIATSELDISPNGKLMVYRNEKAYENEFRKHDVSAFARDIFVMDMKTGQHTQVTTFKGGDHNPVFSDNNTIFYTSEEASGAFNVWQKDLDGSDKKQITNFDQHPVRSLSISKKGKLAFVHHGNIYVKDGRRAKHLDIEILNDNQENDIENVRLNNRVSEFAVSPDGKEVAFVSRGEVFVTSKEFATTVRITNTPGMERSVSFHKDGRTLLYAAQREGRWGLYEASISNDDEPYFFAATAFKEEPVLVTDTDSFQPIYSPDGSKIAFLSARDEIQVIDRETKAVNVALGKQHNYSYGDGDIQFSWAGDSHWLTADFAARGRLFITNIGIFPADGSAEPVDISLSGYSDGAPVWSKKDDVVMWSSTRYGQRDHGSWGREADVMAAFLTQDAYDKFNLSKEEYALKKELDEKEKKEEKEASSDEDAGEGESTETSDDDKETVSPLEIEWKNLDDRTVRLTMHSSSLGQFFLTEDASSLYYLSRFENGLDLWQHNIREKSTKLVSKLNAQNASIQLSPDGKEIYVLANGSLKSGKLGDKISLKNIASSPVMALNAVKERDYIFEYGWRKIKDKFYKEDFHGIDWDFMRESYGRKLPSIGHNRDLANMFAEMTGELNASHIGSSYRPRPSPDADSTGQLGLLFDMKNISDGLTVLEVLGKGPFGKASSRVDAGVKLVSINGVELNENVNLFKHLNHTADKRLRAGFVDAKGESFEEVVKPISNSQQNRLMYQRWVDAREAYVEKISNGRLGYVHIPAMNDASFRTVYSNLLGKHFDKEAVVVDTRWNGGGWLHNDLAKLFSGREYFTMHVRGREYRGDPLDQWTKPSLLLVNEGNYSDGHAIAYTYEELGLGDIVGMPVPGTMTAVWWSTSISGDIRIGVPQVGVKTPRGEYLENKQVEPRYKVNNDPNDLASGADKQLDKAVEVLFETLSQ